MRHLVAAHLRRPAPLRPRLGNSPRPLVGLHRLDLPLDRRRAIEGDQEVSPGAKGSVRDQRTDQRRAVPPGRDAEPDRAARARLPGGARRRQRPLRRRRKRPPRRPALGAGLAPRPRGGELRRDRDRARRRCWLSPSSSPGSAASSPAPACRSGPPSRASPTSGRWRCVRRARRCRDRLVASHQRRHGIGRGSAGLDVRDRPDRPARLGPLWRALRLGLQVLRERDRRRHRTAHLLCRDGRRDAVATLGGWLFDRRDLSG